MLPRGGGRKFLCESPLLVLTVEFFSEEGGRKLGGRPPLAPDPEQAKPEPKAQRNFTDPDSRIMKDGATKEFVQAYNAQAAVDIPQSGTR